MSRRLERVNQLLRQEISKLLADGVKDPRLVGVVTIIRVDTSADLQYAKVFTSVMASEVEKRQVLEGLRSASGFLRRELAHRLSLRVVPHLDFRLDESIEQGAHVLEVMKRLSQEGSPSDV